VAALEDQVGFGNLMAVKKFEVRVVEALGRVSDYRERRDAVVVGIVANQRAKRGGNDIGATADGFGEDEIGLVGGEAAGGGDEVGEAGAEASSGDLIAIEAGGAGEVGVNEVVALVVENGGDAHAALLQKARCGQDKRGLARAEESADYGDHRF